MKNIVISAAAARQLAAAEIISRVAKTTCMRISLKPAKPADAPAIAELHMLVAAKLTVEFGPGPWSRNCTEKGVRHEMRHAVVYLARQQKRVLAVLTLGRKKPWAIDPQYFSASRQPVYLTSMAVLPELQGQGIGKYCIAAARKIAQRLPADTIRLDAYDAAAGAGEFYRKCGFEEVGRATYRQAPLVYLEMPL